jgi:hypothetical protein
MEHLGTWFAIASVTAGFVVLIYLLFKEPEDKKK